MASVSIFGMPICLLCANSIGNRQQVICRASSHVHEAAASATQVESDRMADTAVDQAQSAQAQPCALQPRSAGDLSLATAQRLRARLLSESLLAVSRATWASATSTCRRCFGPARKARTATTWSITAPSIPRSATLADFRALAERGARAGMGILLDVVPNHMGINDPGNVWWLDVLENGEAAEHADYFDIDWRPAAAHLQHKVLLPFLGEPFGEVLESGQAARRRTSDERLAARRTATSDFRLRGRRGLPTIADADRRAARRRGRHRRGARRAQRPARRAAQLRSARSAARRPVVSPGLLARRGRRNQLPPLLRHQRPGGDSRRGSARVRRRAPPRRASSLPKAGSPACGSTIPTGCSIPRRTSQNLQALVPTVDAATAATATSIYVVAEKILSGDEAAAADWAVSGTTGYDLLNLLNRLLVDADGLATLRDNYERLTGDDADRRRGGLRKQARRAAQRAGERAADARRAARPHRAAASREPRLHAAGAWTRRCAR